MAELAHAAVGQLHRQHPSPQPLQQRKNRARRGRCVVGQGKFGCGSAVHGRQYAWETLVVSGGRVQRETGWAGGAGLRKKRTRFQNSRSACQWIRATMPNVSAG